ncbi:hypothetical protein TR51_18415 [Kitasatospora griseola]|uniref:Uncharacterized protein n=1 Tax=Kitasatospora griseola TaxID=2064 RepID=A0A0D0Q499_KITGR|nr:hypothetical protein TR51_18415 [Kitasatospora griseola]
MVDAPAVASWAGGWWSVPTRVPNGSSAGPLSARGGRAGALCWFPPFDPCSGDPPACESPEPDELSEGPLPPAPCCEGPPFDELPLPEDEFVCPPDGTDPPPPALPPDPDESPPPPVADRSFPDRSLPELPFPGPAPSCPPDDDESPCPAAWSMPLRTCPPAREPRPSRNDSVNV